MAKFKINNVTSEHGAISWAHSGLDTQWAEQGDTVSIYNQPTAGWGLSELFYTKTDGSGKTEIIGEEFVMPAYDIIIFASFKRFSSTDWTPEPSGAVVIKVTRSKDIDGHQVPFPTQEEIAEIVANMMEGKVVIIEDKNGRERYLVKFADDYPGGDKVFVIDYYGIMSLTYYSDGTIEVVKLGGDLIRIDFSDAYNNQEDILSYGDLLDYADFDESIIHGIATNPYKYVIDIDGYILQMQLCYLLKNKFTLICNGVFDNNNGRKLIVEIENIKSADSSCIFYFAQP